LQRPDLRTEDLNGDRQVRCRLGYFDDLDHRATAQRNHFSRLGRFGMQHMRGNVVQQPRATGGRQPGDQ
jgi:hypothetical protein